MSVVIASGFTGNVEPINHPRICYDRPAITASASGSADGYDPQWVADGETWSVWEADAASASLSLAFSPTPVSYAGIAAHNLGSTGATITCSAGGSISPTNDDAILFLFAEGTMSGVSFSISGGSAAPRIAVAQAGLALEMPRLSVFTGVPISESRNVSYRHQRSITGDVLGRSTEGAQLEFSLTVNNLPEEFRESTAAVSWKNFVRHTDRVGPFFIAAKPEKYPDDLAYARVTEPPRFSRETPNRLLSGSVAFNCVGYSAP